MIVANFRLFTFEFNSITEHYLNNSKINYFILTNDLAIPLDDLIIIRRHSAISSIYPEVY